MSKKFYYCILSLTILIVVFVLLPSGKRYWYWAGDDLSCFTSDQCECGALGYVSTKSLGFIEIPYYFSFCPPQPTYEEKQEQKRRQETRNEEYRKKEEEKRQKRLQELYNSNICDTGWIPVDKHCERCDSSETFKTSESDCLKCNQYKQVRIYDPQSGECKPKNLIWNVNVPN